MGVVDQLGELLWIAARNTAGFSVDRDVGELLVEGVIDHQTPGER